MTPDEPTTTPETATPAPIAGGGSTPSASTPPAGAGSTALATQQPSAPAVSTPTPAPVPVAFDAAVSTGAWRGLVAGQDEALGRHLAAFETPAQLATTSLQLRRQVTELGERARMAPPPAGATPDQITAWRKSVGAPETVDALRDALSWPDDAKGRSTKPAPDHPVAAALLPAIHDLGLSTKQAQALVDAYYDADARATQAFRTAETARQAQLEAQLADQYGGRAQIAATHKALIAYAESIEPGLGAQWDAFAASMTVDAEGTPTGVVGNSRVLYALMHRAARDYMGDVLPVGELGLTGADADRRLKELSDRHLAATQGRGRPLTVAEHAEKDELARRAASKR